MLCLNINNIVILNFDINYLGIMTIILLIHEIHSDRALKNFLKIICHAVTATAQPLP